jgi:hypothetical protein
MLVKRPWMWLDVPLAWLRITATFIEPTAPKASCRIERVFAKQKSCAAEITLFGNSAGIEGLV